MRFALLNLFFTVYLFADYSFATTCNIPAFPQDFDFSSRTQSLFDAGLLWNLNSLYHPIDNYFNNDTSANEIPTCYLWLKKYLNNYASFFSTNSVSKRWRAQFYSGMELRAQNGAATKYHHLAVEPFFWGTSQFGANWYARLFIRATNEAASLPHYSGVPRDISRAGMNTAEVDQAVIGYRNNALNFEYGRTREIWGPMAEDNLVLAGNSPAYDRLLFQATKGRFTARFFFGFLEAIEDSTGLIQRYIAGRCIQYHNHRNLILGISETSILAGVDRPLDLAFLNPLALHIEIDQNNRSNVKQNLNNAIWVLFADWLTRQNLRLSASFALDEFQLDAQDRKAGRTDALAYFARAAWTITKRPWGITLIATGLRIDTFTMLHSHWMCDFVTKGQPIGHLLGNDADKYSLGMRMVFPRNTLIEIEYGRHRWGDYSILLNPYTYFTDSTFTTLPFPSGQVRKNFYLALNFDCQVFKQCKLGMSGHWDLCHSGEGSAEEVWTLNLRYIFPFCGKWH